jgi:hypothetical protein
MPPIAFLYHPAPAIKSANIGGIISSHHRALIKPTHGRANAPRSNYGINGARESRQSTKLVCFMLTINLILLPFVLSRGSTSISCRWKLAETGSDELECSSPFSEDVTS